VVESRADEIDDDMLGFDDRNRQGFVSHDCLEGQNMMRGTRGSDA